MKAETKNEHSDSSDSSDSSDEQPEVFEKNTNS